MVIMHVVAPAEFGGLERVVQMLGRGLRELGHTVHVVAVVQDPATLDRFLAPLVQAGVHAHPLVVSARAYRQERSKLAALCRRVSPDVVHTHGYRPDLVDARIAQRLGIPVVTTVHGFTGGSMKNRFYEWLERRAFRRFDAVVSVSRPLSDRLTGAGIRKSRVHTVPNAWQPSAPAFDREAARRVLGLPLDGFVVGWVGRLSAEKGPDVLLDALPHLNAVPLAVSIVGDGAERGSLQARAASLGVAGRIRWHGVVPEAGRVFAAFDVCVLSSRTEGTPVVLFEAMATDVPIVTTRVGGVPDVVSSHEAVLVRSEDPVALATGIRAVYEDRAAATGRARAARVRLEREFDIGPWLERYERIYRLVSQGVELSSSPRDPLARIAPVPPAPA